jgi:cellulose synthase/poly-beta-1,6-N-acetylglucosamine synthase-like glycosyltransferase
MTETLLIALAWLFYVYVGYPIALAILSLIRGPRSLRTDNCEPTVSVLIAARNEEKDIRWKLEETLSWDYPAFKLEILVGSDASTDGTDDVLRQFADPRITYLRMKQRSGKVRTLNQLMVRARGDILFFTDANAHVSPDVLRLMVRHFADDRVGCVTGDSRPIKERYEAAVTNGATVYWGYEIFLKSLENRLGSVLVCDGAIFCARRTLCQQLEPNLANDLETPLRIADGGYWIIHEPKALVYERDTASPLEELRRRRRMCAQGMLALMTLPRALRGFRGWQFVSHKLLRWLSLIPMLAIFASTAILACDSPEMKMAMWVQAIFYTSAIVGLWMATRELPVPKVIAMPFYVVWGSFGALVGVVDALMGRRFDVWEIASKSRGQVKSISVR